jgi:hypothetical protein
MKKLASLCALLVMLIVSAPAHAQGVSGEIVIGTPPPPLRAEVVTPAPGPPEQWIWHKGHWRWIDETYVWVPGHWVRAPHPAAVWVEPAWQQRPNGWVFVQGHWK